MTKHVAEHFRISDTTVRNILRRNGLVACRRKKFSDEQISLAVDLYHRGKTTREIAAELSVVRGDACTGGTISIILRRTGVPLRPSFKRHKLSPERRQELALRYAAGEIMEALQKSYGVSNTIVESCLDEFGVKHRASWGKFQTPPWTDARGRVFVFKSRWELAYAQHLDTQGLIWEYEPCKFGLKECSCYTPDFAVYRDGDVEYHEVKGWLDQRTMRRLSEFRRLYPSERLRIVGPSDMVQLGLIDECYSRHPMSGQVEAFKDEHVFACEVICG